MTLVISITHFISNYIYIDPRRKNVLKCLKKGMLQAKCRLIKSAPYFTEWHFVQFVGGDSEAELATTAATLAKSNLRLMVCPVQEEDVGEAEESE
jgi:hypothetical protein